MGTGIQNRPQTPAFQVHGEVAVLNGYTNSGAPEATPRNQDRIGARHENHLANVQGNNIVIKAQAGTQSPPNPVQNPETREAAIHGGRIGGRDVMTTNTQSRNGSGTPRIPKSVAGTADIFNVGGSGGRSATLVRVPVTANKKVVIANLHARSGTTKHNDPTHAPLVAPRAIPVHIGFHHVGYRKG